MNTIFDLKRFFSYEKRELNLLKKRLVLIIGLLAGLYIVSVIVGFAGNSLTSKILLAFTYFAASAIIMISPCIFEPSLDKNKAVFNFILPVSNFERFLGICLKNIIAIPVILIVALMLFNKLALLIGYNSQDNFDSFFKDFLFSLLSMQALFMVGYLYFKKYAVFKTFFVIIAGAIIISVVSQIVLRANGGSEIFFIGVDKLLSPAEYLETWSSTSNVVITTIDVIFKLIFPFGLWGVAYLKLKETEI